MKALIGGAFEEIEWAPAGSPLIKAFSNGGFFITRILKYVCNHKQ